MYKIDEVALLQRFDELMAIETKAREESKQLAQEIGERVNYSQDTILKLAIFLLNETKEYIDARKESAFFEDYIIEVDDENLMEAEVTNG